MTRASDVSAAPACAQCGLPVRVAQRFCCLGCELAAAIGGSGEPARASFLLARIGLAAFLSMNVMMIAFALFGATPATGPLPGWVTLLRWLSLLLALPAMAILVPPLVRAGWSRAGGARLRVELLVVFAAVAAFVASTVNTVREQGDVWFDTATMVLLVVLLGSWLSARARTAAREDLERRFAVGDDRWHVVRDGEPLLLRTAELARNDAIEVGRGARLPVDGIVERSQGAALDASLLTGEPDARRVVAGEAVQSGEVVRDGALTVRATRIGADATLGRMQAALRRALAHPPATARAVDLAARLLVLAAAGCAIGVLVWGFSSGHAGAGITRALALLVVACPCSIGLAAPLVLTRALAAAARLGAVVQSLDGLERLGRVSAVATDKTGTLTEGDAPTLRITPRPGCEPAGADAYQPLLAALAQASQHPLARALRDRLAGVAQAPLLEVHELAGRGQVARTADGRSLVFERATAVHGEAAGALRSTLRIDGLAVLDVELREKLRPGVAALGAALHSRGIAFHVLSGDDPRRVEPLASAVAAEGQGGLSPEEKAEHLSRRRDPDRGIAWLCDGANDAIALAAADVSLVVERRLEWLADAADIVLLGDRVGALPQLIDVARKARARIVAALGWAAVYHGATLTLGVTGRLTPALAALAMAVGSIAVVRLALRPLEPSAAPTPSAQELMPAVAGASPS